MAKALGNISGIGPGNAGDEVSIQINILITGDDTNGGLSTAVSVSVDPSADTETVRAAISEKMISNAREFDLVLAPEDIIFPAFVKG